MKKICLILIIISITFTKKKIIKKQINNNSFDEKDKEIDYYTTKKNKKNLSVRHQTSITSDKPLYTSKRYLATKMKIFKCVIYKNLDPNADENTIKNMLHRNGSQIMENGGFIIKLPNTPGFNYNNYNTQK